MGKTRRRNKREDTKEEEARLRRLEAICKVRKPTPPPSYHHDPETAYDRSKHKKNTRDYLEDLEDEEC